MTNEPFFRRDGEAYVPNPISRGPWDATSLHGRVVIGLLGHEIERLHGGPDFVPARLTVDMYRLPDLSPTHVVTRAVREGRRIKVINAKFFSGGQSMARATCQLLLRTENPPGRIWTPPPWDAPAPDAIARPEEGWNSLGGMWETRPISGAWGSLGQRRLWMREVRCLVDDEPLTPFARVALAADFASPWANSGEEGLAYINSDVTVYLHRLPAKDWIGFDVTCHQATDGIAIGECWLYDQDGQIGTASVTALAQRRGLG